MKTMSLPDINTDLGRRAVVNTAAVEWEPSPSGTVWRKPLYRQGGEYGPVTSMVRYDAGGAFATHYHPQGEEILVLEGVFSDEHGDYPAGTYLLNPDGSRHAPRSREGCILFVRLRQCAGANRPRLILDTNAMDWLPGAQPGVLVKTLYTQPGYPETMALQQWKPGTSIQQPVSSGEEIFVLQGAFEDEAGHYPAGSWLRYPSVTEHKPFSPEGCILYVRIVCLAAGS